MNMPMILRRHSQAQGDMYNTKNIGAVATITELRSKTSELVEYAKQIDSGVLIQKNNEPYAVLMSSDLYDRLLREPERRKLNEE